MVGGTVQPVVWACALPQGREVSASAGRGSRGKESFQCLFLPSLLNLRRGTDVKT